MSTNNPNPDISDISDESDAEELAQVQEAVDSSKNILPRMNLMQKCMNDRMMAMMGMIDKPEPKVKPSEDTAVQSRRYQNRSRSYA